MAPLARMERSESGTWESLLPLMMGFVATVIAFVSIILAWTICTCCQKTDPKPEPATKDAKVAKEGIAEEGKGKEQAAAEEHKTVLPENLRYLDIDALGDFKEADQKPADPKTDQAEGKAVEIQKRQPSPKMGIKGRDPAYKSLYGLDSEFEASKKENDARAPLTAKGNKPKAVATAKDDKPKAVTTPKDDKPKVVAMTKKGTTAKSPAGTIGKEACSASKKKTSAMVKAH